MLHERIRRHAQQAQLSKIVLSFDVEPLVLLLSLVTILFGFMLTLVNTGRYAQTYPTPLLGAFMWLTGLIVYVGVALGHRKVAITGIIGVFFHWFLNSGIIIALAIEAGTFSLTLGVFIAILVTITLACLWCSLRLTLDPQRVDINTKGGKNSDG